MKTSPIWQDLVGLPYSANGRGPHEYSCLGLVIEVQRRVGYEVSDPETEHTIGALGESFNEEWASSWERVDTLQLYDAVMLECPDDTGKIGWHVGVYVEDHKLLVANRVRGVSCLPMSALLKSRYIRGYWRPRKRGTAPTAVELASAPGARPGPPGGVAVAFAGTTVFSTTATFAAIASFVGNAIIAGVVSLLSTLISRPKKPNFKNDESRPAFDIGGPQNTVSPGTTVPVAYGRHQVGGHIAQIFQRVGADLRTRLYMLVIQGEGPYKSVGGFTSDVTNQPSSSVTGRNILINGNPISGYPEARVSVRLGTFTQDPVPGFEETILSGSVDAVLNRTATPGVDNAVIAENSDTVSFTTTVEITAFELLIRFPGGFFKTDIDGNTEPYVCHYTLRYMQVGVPSSAVAELIELGPSTYKGDHTRQIRRANLTEGIYRISLTRSTLSDSNTQRRVSHCIWTSVNQIQSSLPIAHVGRVVLAIEALANDQLSGGIPTVSSIDEGRLVPVWDGVSVTTPTFSIQYSSNNAWVALDILTNKTFALGDHIPLNNIDLEAFLSWAQYCDTVLTTDGVSHVRWSFNHVFDITQRAGDALAQVAAAGRAMIIPLGSKYTVLIDKPTAYSQVFTPGNIVRGSLKRKIADLSERPTYIDLQFLNAQTDWDHDVAVQLVAPTSGRVIKDSLRLIGITDPYQAYRAAKYALNVAQAVLEVMALEGHIDSIACKPFDVIRFAHNRVRNGNGGRVSSAASDLAHIRLDVPLTIPSGWKILVRVCNTSTGRQAFNEVTPTAGTYAVDDEIPISPSFSAAEKPAAGDIWLAGLASTYYTEYRVLRKILLPDFRVRLECIEYNEDSYDDDPGVIVEATERWPSSLAIPDAPLYVSLRESTGIAKDGTVQHWIDVAFQAAKSGLTYDIWWRIAANAADDSDTAIGINWTHAGMCKDGQYRLYPPASWRRTIEVSIVGRSPGGMTVHPSFGSRALIAIQGKCEGPSAPTNLVLSEVADRIVLSWTPPETRDLARVEIRAASDSSRWLFAQVVEKCACGSLAVIWPVIYGVAHYLTVKGVNRSGYPSDTPTAIAVTPSKAHYNFILDDEISGSDWTGSGTSDTNMTLTGSTFASDAAATTAEWNSANYTLLSRRARIHAWLDAIGFDVATTMVEAGFKGNSTYASRMRATGELIDIPWPEQTLRGDEAAFPPTAPLAKVISLNGYPYDWAANFRVVLEYDLAQDSGGAVWDGWKEWTGPIEAVDRYLLRFRVSIAIANAEYKVELRALYVQAIALGSPILQLDGSSDQDDDFLNGASETGEYGDRGWILSQTSAGAALTSTAGEAGHPGIVSLKTSTTKGHYAAMHSGSSNGHWLPQSGTYLRMKFWINIIDTANVTYLIGLTNSVSSTSPSRGIYVTNTGANWRAICKDSSGTASGDPSLALATGWMAVTIEILGTGSVKFTFESDAGTVLGSVTNTTRIPTDTALIEVFHVSTAASAAKELQIDRERIQATGLARS